MYIDVKDETIEGVKNALDFLEALGYKSGGDIHDDLKRALDNLVASRSHAALIEQARRHYGWNR